MATGCIRTAVAVCLLGFQGVVAEGPAELALDELLTLLTLPFVWQISDRRSGDATSTKAHREKPDPRWSRLETLLAAHSACASRLKGGADVLFFPTLNRQLSGIKP